MVRNFLKKRKSAIVFIGDIAVFFASLALTIAIRYDVNSYAYEWNMHIHAFLLILLVWIFVFYASDLYSYTSWRTTAQNLRKFIIAFLLNFFLSISIFYMFGVFFELTPKLNLVIFSSIFGMIDLTFRFIIARILSSKNNNKVIAIISSSPLAEEIIKHCAQHPQLGYTVEKHGGLDTIASSVQKHKDRIIILVDSSNLKDPYAAKMLYELLAEHIEITTLVEFYENLMGCIPLSEVKEEWFIQQIKSDRSFYESIKRIVDIVFVIICGIIFSPLIVLFFILIPLTSKGPAIYKQKRVGKDNKIFTIYKFRNMYSEAEKNPDNNGGAAIWWKENDPRVTRLGKFLRKTHMDELPQLFNILNGDMSLVGPRPERPEFTEKLKKEIPHYFMRETVPPGLTGWAQVNFRYTNTVDEFNKKLEFDLYYIKNRTVMLDMEIIVKTIKIIF